MCPNYQACSSMQRILGAGKVVDILTIIGTSSGVFTAQMKALIPARIAFRVNSASDSRALLDVVGANQLGECGEMMVLLPGNIVEKAFGAVVSSNKIDAVTKYIGSQQGYYESFVVKDLEYDELAVVGGDDDELDPLFEEASRIVVQTQMGSTSMIQRKLKIGYN